MAQRTGSADPQSADNEGRRRRTWGRPSEVAVKDLKGQVRTLNGRHSRCCAVSQSRAHMPGSAAC
jgi:hypothetical protein